MRNSNPTVYIIRGRKTPRGRWLDISYWSTRFKAEQALQHYRSNRLAYEAEVVAIGIDVEGFVRRT